MKLVHSNLIHRLAAAAAAATIALFSAVVAISEPHRSELLAASSARHATHAQADSPQVTPIATAGRRLESGPASRRSGRQAN